VKAFCVDPSVSTGTHVRSDLSQKGMARDRLRFKAAMGRSAGVRLLSDIGVGSSERHHSLASPKVRIEALPIELPSNRTIIYGSARP
jgi:hypothetical protein